MNAFGEALNLVFMRRSGDFSSYSPANGLNLRLHSHEFLFPANESQDCIPMSSYSLPMNLRMHPMSSSSYSLPMNLKTQTAFP